MPWVVDTCLLIDVAQQDSLFGIRSAALIDSKVAEGLVICPVTYVELAPVFGRDLSGQDEFLFETNITFHEPWTQLDTVEAAIAWHRYVSVRRATRSAKRPIADILIGAFALRFTGLLTGNAEDFRPLFPTLNIAVP